MSSKLMVMDKENAGGISMFHTGKLNPANISVTKTVLSNIKCTQQLSTPKLASCERISSLQTSQPGILSKQRRALGDVFNTTSSKHVNATPTTQKCLNFVKTPSSNVKLGSNGRKASGQVKSSLKMENSSVHDLLPVEQCHIYTDTFDDLFENGKMSHLFLNQNVNFIARLPTGNANSHFKHETGKETYHLFEQINNENEWQKNMKSINKLLRKERKTDSNNVIMEMEMPELEAPTKLMLID